ncbi:MAG: DJ-1/PfpI family protein [Treponema sp.]|nr:DJ-1/PfpI family protein [Treponema sp.]
MTKKAVILMADGFEEVEAVTPIDYLQRAGIEVTKASVTSNLSVKGRWGGITMLADITLAEILKQGTACYDAVIVPGGMPGASNIAASKEAGTLLNEMAAAGKLICAICASPVIVLSALGIIAGKRFTCYPGMEEKITEPQGCIWSDDRVVVDGNIITSRGAGTAAQWSMAIIEKLLGRTSADKIAAAVLL